MDAKRLARQYDMYGELKPVAVYGDEFLPKSVRESLETGDFAYEVDLLTGHNANEGSFYLNMKNPVIFNPIAPTRITRWAVERELLPGQFNDKLIEQIALRHYFDDYNRRTNSSAGLRNALMNATGDYYMVCPTVEFSRLFAAHSPPSMERGRVYSYYLNQKPNFSLMPSCSKSTWMGVWQQIWHRNFIKTSLTFSDWYSLLPLIFN